MFNSSRSFLLTLFTLLSALSFLSHSPSVLAAPHGSPNTKHAHARIQVGTQNQNSTVGVGGGGALGRRFDGARLTYYDAGQNACGSTDSDSAYVIALSSSLYNGGEHCYKPVTIEYNGKKVQATVTDECPGCKDSQADVSRPLFAALAPLDEGVIYANWWFD
ncbi:hypothetical protein OH77DRAFT_1526439 [Trametes cingulata]|nr:hypothetical protein OH77DRAFT_1526439 [Trametes cingulata]